MLPCNFSLLTCKVAPRHILLPCCMHACTVCSVASAAPSLRAAWPARPAPRDLQHHARHADGTPCCCLCRQYAAHVRVHFLTNLAVAGGLTLLQSLGAGRCSLSCMQCWAQGLFCHPVHDGLRQSSSSCACVADKGRTLRAQVHGGPVDVQERVVRGARCQRCSASLTSWNLVTRY